MDSPAKVLKALKQAKKILIPLHLSPDGDMVGSALALYHLLKTWGKEPSLASADPLPAHFLFLPNTDLIAHQDPADLDLAKYDLLLLVDGDKPPRFSRKDFQTSPQIRTINIDHHVTNDGRNADLNLVDHKTSSAAELIMRLTEKEKVKITPTIAQYLLTGIIGDTGCFRYNITPATMEKVTKLINLGVSLSQITFHLYRDWPPTALALWQTLLKNAKVEGGILHTTLSQAELKKMRVAVHEISNLRSYAARNILGVIAGVELVAIFTEEEKAVRVNLLTRRVPSKYNVGEIAKRMGNGGHQRAAGFGFEGSLVEAIKETIKEIKKDLK
jgi:phosphoesterase RecJ-like protein